MNGLAGSMGRVASAADNAAMESFHSLLRKNVLDQRRTWESLEQVHLAIVIWIEHTYNNRRRQRRLGKLTPVEFELAFAATHAEACSEPISGDWRQVLVRIGDSIDREGFLRMVVLRLQDLPVAIIVINWEITTSAASKIRRGLRALDPAHWRKSATLAERIP